MAQDIYIGGGGTPGPLPPSKVGNSEHQPLTLPPILKSSLSNANIINGGAGVASPYKEEFGMQPFGTKPGPQSQLGKELSERRGSSRQSQSQRPAGQPSPLPLGTNVPNAYNDGGNFANKYEPEFVVPVLPSSDDLPAYAQRELNSEKDILQPIPQSQQSLDSQNGIIKMNDFQRKIRDLELQLIDQKAQTERNFTAMREALFAKLERDIKNIAAKQEQ